MDERHRFVPGGRGRYLIEVFETAQLKVSLRFAPIWACGDRGFTSILIAFEF